MSVPSHARTRRPAAVPASAGPDRPVAAVAAPGRSNQAAQRRAADPLRRFTDHPGSGTPLPSSVEEALHASFGPGIGTARVHTDPAAEEAARRAGARAFTFGEHIAFAPGQFDTGTREGRALLRHELAHVLQQREAGPGDDLPTVSTPGDAFERAADGAGPMPRGLRPPSIQRQPEDGGGPDAAVGPPDAETGPSDAGAFAGTYGPPPALVCELAPDVPVEVNGIQVPADEAGQQRLLVQLFRWGGPGAAYELVKSLHTRISEIDQEVAAAHQFAEQVAAGQSPSAGVPWSDQMFLDRQAERDQVTPVRESFERQIQPPLNRLGVFKQLVRNAAVMRLEGNRKALAQWKDYLHTRLSPEQLRRQVFAETQRSAIAAVTSGPHSNIQLEALQRQSAMTHVRERAVEDRVARRLIHGGCEYCHEMQHAFNLEYAHPELDVTTPPPRQLLESYALREERNPTPLPGFLPEAPSTGLDPQAVAGYPGVAAEVQAIQKMRPILRQLGPDGFKVIDPRMISSGLSDTELLAALDEAIERRRANFSLFEQRIQEPGFDYLILRPVLRELLPLADPAVRALVEWSLDEAESDGAAEAIVIGAATVLVLLLTIFPPTALLGLAMGIGLGAYGVISGIEQYEQGQLLSLGVGSDVLDPAQQEAAAALMSMGALSVVLSAVGIGMTGLGAVRMIRSGAGATAVLEGIEAEAAGNRITVSQLNTSNPRALVVSADGTVVVDESLTELSLMEGGGIPGGGGPRQNVLVVGAETEAEFSYATDVSRAGQPVTVVNPVATEEAQAFAARGGNFVQGRIEDLPASPSYTMIREDYPFPLGRAGPPTEEFATARITRLAPGGRWVTVTEDAEFANTLDAVATRQGARVIVREIPAAHEGAPVSAWPKEHQRLVLIIEKDPLMISPEGAPPVSPSAPPTTTPPTALTSSTPAAETSSARIGRPPPVDVLDEAINVIDAADNPFTLNIGVQRAREIRSGARDFALDCPAGFDIDEPLAVGASDVSRARAVNRALDPHNRQLLDPATNQRTKYLGTSSDAVARHRTHLAPVSVVDEPAALFTCRFDEVTELQQIFDEAVGRVRNIRSLRPTAIKDRINANMRGIIGAGRTPAGILVRDALRSLGYEYVPGRGIVAVRSVASPPPPGTVP